MSSPVLQGVSFSLIVRTGYRSIIFLFTFLTCIFCPTASEPEKTQSNVVCREQVSVEFRYNLAGKLREITGWPDLKFDRSGALQRGAGESVGGSQSARELVTKIIHGKDFVVLEDASNRSDVVFARLVAANWRHDPEDKPPAHIVLIDLADFKHVMGDKRALSAFNVGWALLHEFDHIASDSEDALTGSETGECESHINQMRRECDLPQRADYFFTPFPLTTEYSFTTQFVRLSFFENHATKKKRQYWLIWDASLVGGLDDKKQIAALR